VEKGDSVVLQGDETSVKIEGDVRRGRGEKIRSIDTPASGGKAGVKRCRGKEVSSVFRVQESGKLT